MKAPIVQPGACLARQLKELRSRRFHQIEFPKTYLKKLGLPLWSHLTGYSGYAVFPGNTILRIRVLENQ
jgi:hypothetical protein